LIKKTFERDEEIIMEKLKKIEENDQEGVRGRYY